MLTKDEWIAATIHLKGAIEIYAHGILELKKVTRTAGDHPVEQSRLCKQQDNARYALLAYGYLRGMPYKRIENKTRDDNEAQMLLIATFVAAATNQNADRDDIDKWLKAPEGGPRIRIVPSSELSPHTLRAQDYV